MAVLYAMICMRSSAPSRVICAEIDLPKTIRVDQGSEFVSRDRDLWACLNGVMLDLSRPGKPMDKASVEAFNGGFRHEFLSAHLFLSLADTRQEVKARCRFYSSIGYNVPMSLADSGALPACRRDEAGIFQTRATQSSGTALQQEDFSSYRP